MKRMGKILIIASLVGEIGCSSMSPQQKSTASGAAIGAAAGAGIAAIGGGSAWTGAAVGAVAGGAVGHMKGEKQE